MVAFSIKTNSLTLILLVYSCIPNYGLPFNLSPLFRSRKLSSTRTKAALLSMNGITTHHTEKMLRAVPLKDTDQEVYNIIKAERNRQRNGVNLIASENYVSHAVLEALGSEMTNKYSEGQPGKRYYGGNKHIDELELLCQKRALACFGLDPQEWGVNVQPYGGSVANFAVYMGLLCPGERLMGMGLNSGGHLSHGYFSEKRKVSGASLFFESEPYHLNESGLIDYGALAERSKVFKPQLLICGSSSYPRNVDYRRMREISDECHALLMVDIAHISGLVAAGVLESPFQHCHVVTTTTHKSLRGPRSALIFYRHKFKTKIDNAVFPGLQGGPHNHQIAAVAVALQEAMHPDFKVYAAQVLLNARALAEAMLKYGYYLATGGTDNHLVLWDTSKLGLSGQMVEKCLDLCSISVNRNTMVASNRSSSSSPSSLSSSSSSSSPPSPLDPCGVRLGTCAMTSRGMKEKDMRDIALFIHRAIEISLAVKTDGLGSTTGQFISALKDTTLGYNVALEELKKDVEAFADKFQMP